MKTFRRVALGVATLALASSALGNHSWGGYHWARTSNPFTVKLGNNLSSNWQTYLSKASSDWSQSTVLNTTVVPGLATTKRCRPTAGRDEICNDTYGNNGWLGIANIWLASGSSHITQGTVRLNDTYFNSPTYDSPAWRQMVACQEIGHTFGLDHQDTNFNNANLGTCMDYTNDPSGTAGTNGTKVNTSPNQHDYDELVTIYTHFDSTTTIAASTNFGIRMVGKPVPQADEGVGGTMADWGRAIHFDGKGRPDLFMNQLSDGRRILTHVFWTLEAKGN